MLLTLVYNFANKIMEVKSSCHTYCKEIFFKSEIAWSESTILVRKKRFCVSNLKWGKLFYTDIESTQFWDGKGIPSTFCKQTGDLTLGSFELNIDWERRYGPWFGMLHHSFTDCRHLSSITTLLIDYILSYLFNNITNWIKTLILTTIY